MPGSDIFVSYASEDRARATTLVAALQKEGYSVWWDRTILPGKTFDQVIERELAQAKCVIVIWSDISIKKHWVLSEASDALDRGVLIPVRVADVKIPLQFRRVQAASLAHWQGDGSDHDFLLLLGTINELLGHSHEAPRGDTGSSQGASRSGKVGLRFDKHFWIALAPGATLAALSATVVRHRLIPMNLEPLGVVAALVILPGLVLAIARETWVRRWRTLFVAGGIGSLLLWALIHYSLVVRAGPTNAQLLLLGWNRTPAGNEMMKTLGNPPTAEFITMIGRTRIKEAFGFTYTAAAALYSLGYLTFVCSTAVLMSQTFVRARLDERVRD